MQQASTTALPDQQGISYPTPSRQTPITPSHGLAPENRHRKSLPAKVRVRMRPRNPARPRSSLRGRFRRDATVPAYLREHSPDFGSYRGRPGVREDLEKVPGSSPPLNSSRARPGAKPPTAPRPEVDPAHSEADASPTPEAGRPWASGQLVFNAGPIFLSKFSPPPPPPPQFESARSGFADYAKDGESGEQLRTRVNRIILEDLEQKVLALRALHAKLRDREAGESFAGVVARGRPT